MLSKSRFTRGLNCKKSLWLYKHKRDEQFISDATQAVFARGTSVGELAQTYFPGGIMAVRGELPGYDSFEFTKQLINQGVETIYEATFIFEDTLVAVDILHKQNGKWYLYEVKSTNSAKPEHNKDVAVQYYVASGCGIKIEHAYVMHFDRSYVIRGELDVKKLFIPTEITNEVLLLQPLVKETIPQLLELLKGEEPDVEMGNHCKKPYHCDFYEYCAAILPDVKGDSSPMSDIPEIQHDNVASFLSSLEYPLCHLDFETIMPGVPMFNESRPYQQVCFQYSVHYQHYPDGEIVHSAYLAPSDIHTDPREGLIQQLIRDTDGAKTILVYNQAFEQTRIKEMIRDFPQYASELKLISEKLADLMIPFRKKDYSTESMEGRYSIKVVLPVLCPDVSYDNLEIGDGMTASNTFLDLYFIEDKELVYIKRQALLEYCHLDTLAMVKILGVLKNS